MTDASTEIEVQRLRETMEQIVPDAAIRSLALNAIADSIELANAGKTSSWSLKIKLGGGLQLFVANPKLVEIGREKKLYLLVDNADATADVQDCIDAFKHPDAPQMPSDPHATRLLIPFDQLADVLPKVRIAHEKIILRHRGWGSFRPTEHSPVALQYLRGETGRNLPDSPHQFRGGETRINPVRSAMEKAYPDPEMRLKVMTLLANSIELAHAENPKSWCLTFPGKGHLRLNIGSMEAVIPGAYRPDTLTMTIDAEVLPAESSDLIQPLIVPNENKKSYPSAERIGIPVARLDEILPIVLPAHDQLITGLRKHNTGWWPHHSSEALQYLRDETGREELPDPAYATELSSAPTPAWKLSIGDKKSNLKFLTDHQIMALEFDYIAFDINETRPTTKDEYRTALEVRGIPWNLATNNGPLLLANFLFDVRPGDRLYLYYDKAIRASGFVSGDYYFQADAPKFRHRRDAALTDEKIVPISNMSNELRKKLEKSYMTLEPLTMQQADEIDRLLDDDLPPPDWRSAYRKLFADEGLHYTPWQQAVFFTALQTKGFVILSGISGTGKTKIAQAFSAALPQPDDGRNVEFLTVRPDWRDSKSLLGYHNPITDRYEWTPFLRFLLRARASWEAGDGLAWFVILDEMNLAHVEHYFAELLSVLESGRDAEGWTREAIHLPSSGAEGSPPASLKLPPNLHIIGTVNLDETTHAFSPKVLDRAFAMELSDVSFTGFPFAITTGDSLSDAERDALLDAFSMEGTFPRIDQAAISARIAVDGRPRDWLESLNRQLRPHHMHFGYRVFAEIMAFVDLGMSNKLFSGFSESADALETTFDAAVLMKVLPKFHGSRAKLEGPLTKVLGWCLDPEHPDTMTIANAINQAASPDALEAKLLELPYTFPETAHRAIRLLWSAQIEGFAAFG